LTLQVEKLEKHGSVSVLYESQSASLAETIAVTYANERNLAPVPFGSLHVSGRSKQYPPLTASYPVYPSLKRRFASVLPKISRSDYLGL
jgi:hypothetical protein